MAKRVNAPVFETGANSAQHTEESSTYNSTCNHLACLKRQVPDLAEVVNAWGSLSKPIKAAVQALIRSSTE